MVLFASKRDWRFHPKPSGAAPVPSFERPVERALVHRRSTSEVWPTDFESLGESTFRVSLQWPRSHAFYATMPPDSAVIAETIRQVTILTCHLGYAVPLDRKFLMTGLGFELRDQVRNYANWAALELTALVRPTDVRRTARGDLRSARMNIEISGPAGVSAVGHGDALLANEGTYRRMRGRNSGAHPPQRTAVPVSPASVGRRCDADVVLVETEGGLEVQVDQGHPVFFEHSLDHVPGVALIEGFKQAARLYLANPSAELGRFESSFHRMVEFDAPALVSIVAQSTELQFAVIQNGTAAMNASACVRFSPCAAASA